VSRKEWLAEQDRRRRLIASGYTAALYAFAFLLAWGVGLLRPNELAEMPGTVVIGLDTGDGSGGLPLGLETAPERPAGAAAQPPAPPPPAAARPIPGATAAMPAPAQAAPKAPAAVSPKSAPPAEESPAPAPGGIPQPKVAAAAPVAAANAPAAGPAAPPAPAPSRTFGSVPSAAGAAAGGPGAPGVQGGTGTVTYKGVEYGNALDTVFGGGSGTVGRSLYVPIYLYMPLPARVDDAVYQRIPMSADKYFSAEDRKAAFRSFYSKSGDAWTLKGAVPFARRPSIWLMLEDADYDLAGADYKALVSSPSVVLEFAVSNATAVSKPVLVDLSVTTSSGSKDIDEAVAYGFKQAAFFNKNAFAVSGKFVYKFGK
jgi:hypothetical protein